MSLMGFALGTNTVAYELPCFHERFWLNGYSYRRLHRSQCDDHDRRSGSRLGRVSLVRTQVGHYDHVCATADFQYPKMLHEHCYGSVTEGASKLGS